jgi:hypothetical protein
VLGAGVPFVGALACWQRTPLEKPLRAAVAKAVSFIAEKTPANYYRHAE